MQYPGNEAYEVPRVPPPPSLNKERRRQYGLCSQGDYSIDPRIYLPIELFTFSPAKISFFWHVCRKLRSNDGPRPHSMAPLSRVDSRYIALNTWCPLICYVKLFTHFLTTHAALINNIINRRPVCTFKVISAQLRIVSGNDGDRKKSLGATSICLIEFDWIRLAGWHETDWVGNVVALYRIF